ncbi:hydroxyacid dehydrogenase [Haladaptatus sp. W1]|uniref:NAD(P)-dependent oxidoreductase n=1 Tax=Haladaptatus sp. W1 TaxID=1897478 RepID=UPI000849C117|nr:NAD(P)-dependent oxidoreductase [Haladaptatus sp. W1]ODR82591.1 hydroxyacid dehydrogenase [Haladaptatus sp. W1]
MTRTIVVDPLFEDVWPLAADHLHRLWTEDRTSVEFVRLPETRGTNLSEAVSSPESVEVLVSLGVRASVSDLQAFTNLTETFVMTDSMYGVDEELANYLRDRGVTVHDHTKEGFWSESVSEFGIGLTINALRQIPQKHTAMTETHDPWDLDQLDNEVPGARGHQFADDPNFVSGTVARKRVRVAGIGNIGSRYAATANHLGADVAAYDPFADEPCFHSTGTRRVYSMEELVSDADVFAPTIPLTPATEGVVTADHIDALPDGAILILVTRAGICDMDAVRERVLADEIVLAADVWDEEPLSLDDPLLGRHNVVHTPHIAGRTRDANERWAEHLAAHFSSP